jgi:cytochrome c5
LGHPKKNEEKTVRQIKKLLGMMVVGGLLAASGFAFSQSSDLTAEMKARIAPVGSVCKAGESCAAAPVAAASSGPRTGKEIYDTSCGTCHAIGVAGAPKMGDAADWGARLGKGIETLYTHAIEGFNGMPPKGLCATCSDDEIKVSVDYLVENSK